MFETNLISVAMAAENIKTKAELVYWNVPSSAYQRANMHEDFHKLAKLLGYIIIAKEQDNDNA
jgi:hypothetical protein